MNMLNSGILVSQPCHVKWVLELTLWWTQYNASTNQLTKKNKNKGINHDWAGNDFWGEGGVYSFNFQLYNLTTLRNKHGIEIPRSDTIVRTKNQEKLDKFGRGDVL